MESAPLHPDEQHRLEALRALGVLDTSPTEQFDRLSRLAARLLGTPIALISLVDEHRQWFLSRVGLETPETPRDHAFCAHAIVQHEEDLLIVNDATADLRFVDNPLVINEPNVRFYAGHVVRDPTGFPVGTVCVIDRTPREFDEADRRTLGDLAALVEAELDRHARAHSYVHLNANEQAKALILRTMHAGFVLHDADGRIIDWNPAAEELLGLTGDELSGRTSLDPRWRAVHHDLSDWPGETHPAMQALQRGIEVRGATMGVHRTDGDLVWLEVDAHPIVDDDGRVIAAMASFHDRTSWFQLEADLRHSREVAATSLDALSEGVLLIGMGGVIERSNPAAERILGFDADELSRRWISGEWMTWDEFGNPIAEVDRPIVRAIRQTAPVHGELVSWERADGERVLLRLSVVPVVEANKLVVSFVDVTHEQVLERRLDRLSRLFERSEEIIQVVGPDGTVLDTTPSRERFLVDPDLADEANALERLFGEVHPHDVESVEHFLDSCRAGLDVAPSCVLRVRSQGGDWRWIEASGADLASDPVVGGLVVSARDVTERELLTQRLAHAATHDDLTGLANRRVLHDRISESLARSLREDRRMALCYIDLDRFKVVNDTFGHAAGDQVLRDVAALLKLAIRGGDTAARVGGDEFVVVLDALGDPDEPHQVARRIRDAISTLGAAFGDELSLGASVGVAVSELDDTPESLLARADQDMFESRRRHQVANAER